MGGKLEEEEKEDYKNDEVGMGLTAKIEYSLLTSSK